MSINSAKVGFVAVVVATGVGSGLTSLSRSLMDDIGRTSAVPTDMKLLKLVVSSSSSISTVGEPAGWWVEHESWRRCRVE